MPGINDVEITYQSFVGLEGLAGLRPRWLELLTRPIGVQRMCHNPFWYRCYLECLVEHDYEMCFVAAMRRDQIVAIVPLVTRTRRRWGASLRTLELPFDRVNYLRDVIAASDGAQKVSMEKVVRAATSAGGLRGDLLVLDQFLEDSHLVRSGVLGCYAPSACVISKCFYHNVQNDGHANSFSSTGLRKSLRKQWKRLAKLGAVAYVVAPFDLSLNAALDSFLDVEAASWKGDAGARSAVKYSQRHTRFLRSLAMGGDGLQCQVHLLRVDGRTVAGAFCIFLSGTLYTLLSGYDAAFERVSPGQCLRAARLEWAVNNPGISEANYLTGADYYERWNPLSRKLLRVYGWPDSLRGYGAMWAGRLATKVAGARVDGGRLRWRTESGQVDG